ncbi:hypothetical protein V6H34_004993 [Vibrio harveyi]
MDEFIKIGLFLLGVFFSVLLVPLIEKKKSDFQRELCKKSLMAELEDIQSELNGYIKQHFQFLVRLRTETDLVSELKLHVPMPKAIDVHVLSGLYIQSSTLLTSEQRITIKRIPSSIEKIMKQSQASVDSVLERGEYCVQSTKNTIKLACLLVCEINQLIQECERFKKRGNLDSNSATPPVLLSLGFTAAQIQVSQIEETKFQ